MKKVAILGSTGSVGRNTVSVVQKYADVLSVCALTAHTRTKLLAEQAKVLGPAFLGVTGEKRAELPGILPDTRVCFGADALIEACQGADIVVLAVVGMAGLPAFEYCLRNHIPVALANKESMVCGGRLARQLMDETNTPVLPVDSESYAIFQCLLGREGVRPRRIHLTASGGPFRQASMAQMERATVEDALAHPNWSMGDKITIDSATMMNKGLEVIENKWLYDLDVDQINVVVQPESVIHSMVEFEDHSVLAQMAVSDMRLPIAGALLYPDMPKNAVAPLDLFAKGTLHFERPDLERFPCLALAIDALRQEGGAPIALNSANEIAVERFLNREIGFMDIYRTVEDAVRKFGGEQPHSFADIYALDHAVREYLGGSGKVFNGAT